MDWIQILTLIISNLAMIFTFGLWNRSEANADRREFNAQATAIRMEMREAQNKFEAGQEKTDKRIDHLYEICVEILKTRR